MQNTLRINKIILNVLASAVLILISLAIVFVIGEIFFRIFEPQNIVPRYVKTGHYGIRENIGNVHGEMITSEYRHEFNTNSQGFRGKREYSLKKLSNVYRVIVLGDSITLGYGVEDEETFSAVLEERLSRIKPTEVINLGVSGFGTAEELIHLRKVGLKFNPDMVILAYFPNDPYNNIVSKLFKLENGKLVRNQKNFVPALFIRDRLYKIPGYYYLSQHSHLVNYFRRRISYYFVKKLSKKENLDPSTSPKILTERETNLTASLINEFITEVNKYKIPLIILNIPLVENGEMYSNFPGDKITHKKDAYVIDVKNQIYTDYSNDELYYEKDAHPKPLGHKLIEEWLEFFIKDKVWKEN